MVGPKRVLAEFGIHQILASCGCILMSDWYLFAQCTARMRG